VTTTPPGTYHFGESGRLTVFEAVTAANPPTGSESWPVAEVTTASRLTVLPPVNAAARDEIVALSRQLAERLASVPAEQRAELLAEINRALAAAG
jgi:acyl-CoA reductase-like NAD-dependent aldehyde dehydrogenase